MPIIIYVSCSKAVVKVLSYRNLIHIKQCLTQIIIVYLRVFCENKIFIFNDMLLQHA